MATAILRVDPQQITEQIRGTDGYQEALVYLTVNERLVGQLRIPLKQGRATPEEIRKAILKTNCDTLWEAWLKEHLQIQEAPASEAPIPLASVVVCTRDRPGDLRECLQALIQMPDNGQEILVVDSFSSSDETRWVVEQFPDVRYLREDQPGLDRARNRGLREAKHDIVAFCDDDAQVEPQWLRNLVKNFTHPWIHCVTGLTLPIELETPAQEWFERISPFQRGFRRREFTFRNINPLRGSLVGAGANMAVRRSTAELIDGFDTALDAGTLTGSGGDTEFFSRLLLKGFTILYDPSAISLHRHRRTWEELRKTYFNYGSGTSAVWTSLLLNYGEWGVVPLALTYTFRYQIPALLKSLLRLPGQVPFDLLLADFQGYMRGPGAYLKKLRLLAKGGNP